MTKNEGKSASATVKEILLEEPDVVRELMCVALQEVLEAEMDHTLGAAKGERTTRLPLRPLRPHTGHPCRQAGAADAAGSGRLLLDRAVRALPTFRASSGGDACADVCAGRVDPQDKGDHRGTVRHAFSASSISAINKRLDESLKAFAEPFDIAPPESCDAEAH